MSSVRLCELCLSAERALSSVEHVAWAYRLLTDAHEIQSDREVSVAETRVCWECRARLLRMQVFRAQALRAREALTAHSQREWIPSKCLSNLSCYIKTHYDKDLQYNEDVNNKNNNKDRYSVNEEEIKSEIDYDDAVDFDVFADPMALDVVEANVSHVKVKNDVIAESKEQLIEPNVNTPVKSKHEDHRSSEDMKPEIATEKSLQNELDVNSSDETFNRVESRPKAEAQLVKSKVSSLVNSKKQELKCLKGQRSDKRFKVKPRHKPPILVDKRIKKKLDEHENSDRSEISSLIYEKIKNPTDEQLMIKLTENEANGVCQHRCILCSLTFNSEEESQKHIEEHRTHGPCDLFRCRLCSHLTGDAAAMRRHRAAQHSRVRRGGCREGAIAKSKSTGFNCDVCGLYVKTYCYFKMHYETHTTPRTYQCDTCGATYSLRNQLLRHIKRHEMRYLCDICGKRSSELAQLNLHYLSHSTMEARPHACAICPRRFISKDKLTAHLTFHEGVKPFQCDLCDRRFRVNTDLTRHKKLKHKIGEQVKTRKIARTKSFFRYDKYQKTIEKTSKVKASKTKRNEGKELKLKLECYQCVLCGRKFTQKGGLDAHAVFHTGERPHKCDECDLTFKYQSGLWSHKLVHKGVKPHQCTICGAQFTLKGNLNGHLKTHSNDKPYECDICGQRFLWRRNLRNHLKVHAK